MKKFVAVILVAMSALTFVSCMSATEPKDLAIVNSVIYDLEEDGTYLTQAELLKSSAEPEASNKQSVFIEGKAKSLDSSINDIANSIDGKMFNAHNKSRIFTDSFAKDSFAMNSYIQYIVRNPMSNEKACMMVLKKDDKEKLGEATFGLSSNLGEYVANLIEYQKINNCEGVNVTTLDFINKSFAVGIEPVAGILRFEKVNDGYAVKSAGLAVFKNGALVGELDAEGAKVYNIMSNKPCVAVINLDDDNGNCSVKLINPKTEVKVELVNGKLKGKIDVCGKLKLVSLNNYQKDVGYDLMIESIQSDVNRLLEENIQNAIKTCINDYKSDIFGFGRMLQAKSPSDWEAVADNFDNILSNCQFEINCKTKIMQESEILAPLDKKE